ncbi:hypothetical protein MTR67_018369 [Solanum verrucosum]|uniref:Integrase catalytic domain-containing protein n=1 Tax=Solanum verrucosum TaxID=315347 RepID=A0AAF0TMM3_SOLVR|nr:hypothetical protein MTR67_018369 [Solanum verrucosum]
MTKSDHYLPMKTSFSSKHYARLYIWKMKGLGTKVKLKTTFHPQTDGQARCTIQTIEYMLRVFVINFKSNCDDHLPLIEFSYNSNYHSSIQIAPFEALYGRRCRFLLIGLKLVSHFDRDRVGA